MDSWLEDCTALCHALQPCDPLCHAMSCCAALRCASRAVLRCTVYLMLCQAALCMSSYACAGAMPYCAITRQSMVRHRTPHYSTAQHNKTQVTQRASNHTTPRLGCQRCETAPCCMTCVVLCCAVRCSDVLCYVVPCCDFAMVQLWKKTAEERHKQICLTFLFLSGNSDLSHLWFVTFLISDIFLPDTLVAHRQPTSSLSFRPSLTSGMPLRNTFITILPFTSHRRTVPLLLINMLTCKHMGKFRLPGNTTKAHVDLQKHRQLCLHRAA